MPEPQYKDLIFPSQEAQPSLSSLLTSLRTRNLSIHNRLTSIRTDSSFILHVASLYPSRPLIANERCGSWYIPPERKGGSAYFKSTDGHERAWKFSTRRLNLHLVDAFEKHDGAIIVDSTRRGKRMPDALSTTIPIWCTVINLFLLPDHPLSGNLFLPPSHSSSTHAQIKALIPEFLASLKALNLASVPTTLTKPLRPYWVTQDSQIEAPHKTVYSDYRPVICCTASRRVVGGSESDEGGYIQGAADDTENWAHGLTPDIFWRNVDDLLATDEDDLSDLIHKLIAQDKSKRKANANLVQVTPRMCVCPLPLEPDASACCIKLTSETSKPETWAKSPRLIEVGLGSGKAASRNLRLALPHICTFASKSLDAGAEKVIIACESGRDLSVGTALALSCYLFEDDAGTVRPAGDEPTFTKTFVKMRLGTIMTAYPAGNPSRNTLQAVNSFLMDWRR
ncbi:tRNA A64-2'-O-ribosylphosphate transferase [Emericellopsis atlantica]|uniref:tRNA A64-2'-O-ribosylphosphate transferase n=1 Tax=Emericellopsis atlantica TaxID=2614577 RepID=A0A9P7ZFG1_9HYPO|nr:tRNA A64-2'-O-ribosylphosphate transferase [Emericellopsis atlantica]KAG9250961.1 tRNA A64-2'-O-ribosylphosphate transferase [Emericellopsis atlantica]